MRRVQSLWNSLPFRKVDAIAALCALTVVGLAFKLPLKSQADSLDTPATTVKQTQATATERVLQRQKQLRQIRPDNYDLQRFPITAATANHWRHLLWTTAVVEPKEEFVATALNQILALTTETGLSTAQLQTVDQAMKVATQLYLSDAGVYRFVGERFLQTVEQSPDPEWVAVALSGLAKGKLAATELLRLSQRVKARFPGWSDNVYLRTTIQDIEDQAADGGLPPIADLLKWEVAPDQLQLYVLCRSDRRILCRAILKDRDGNFLRHEQDGKLWSVPLLLESIYELGWNFTRGQTPQGIYRIEGTVSQPDTEFFRAYGQFSLVNLYVPFEGGVKQFLPGQPGPFEGNLQTYQRLLPPSWRNYRPMQQSFWAGKAGRSLFRIHGSGESPDFFQGKDSSFPESYNWNPTIGCLSARELYNDQGQLIHADMPGILKALTIVGGKDFAGYLMVVDVPGDDLAPVALAEIEQELKLTKASAGKRAGQAQPKVPRKQAVRAAGTRLVMARSPQGQQGTTPAQVVPQQVAKLTRNLDKLGKVDLPGERPTAARSPQVPANAAEDLAPLPTAY